jgi:hypothetical protein
MSDEVDDLLRRAMATLDHQAPSGYFDTLADRALARLDGPALAELSAEPFAEPSGDNPELNVIRIVDPVAPRVAIAGDAGIGTPAPRPRPRRRLVAAIAVGLAAAAGAVIFVSVRDKDASAPTTVWVEAPQRAERSRVFSQEGVTATPRSSPAAPSQPGASANAIAVDPAEQAARAGAGSTGFQDATKGAGNAADHPAGKSVGKPVGKVPSKLVGESSGAGSGGVTFDRKQLSSADIKRAMTAVAAQARACSDGTAGPAPVQLLVAPNGRIQEVTVSGLFAGTPVGTCIERAVRTARFPPWDGPPQRFDFSFRFSE